MMLNNRTIRTLLAGVAFTGLSGCFIPTPDTVVELLNATNGIVSVRLFYDDDQETIDELLEAFGVELETTLSAGQTFSFGRDCDDLQAIFIEDAKLELGLGLGPDDETRVYRDGSDFGCGDTIRFTFTTNDFQTDLDTAFALNP